MDLDQTPLDRIIDDLKQIGNKQIVLHGHGETTIVPQWDQYAKVFLDNGFELITCTNLAKTFTEQEIEILSKFISITVSIDTFDEQKFSELRRGGQLSKLVYNMTRINAARIKNNSHGNWGWSCVITKETLDDLIDLISSGLSLGVKIFSLCNLTKINDVSLTHLAELDKKEALEAKQKLRQAQKLCMKNNAYFDMKGGLIESLNEACNQ